MDAGQPRVGTFDSVPTPPSGGVVVWALATLALAACSGDPPPDSECGLPSTPIHTIQGSGPESPLIGIELRVEAAATLAIAEEDRQGMFLQHAAGAWDQDPETSEGLFVQGAIPPEWAGNRVRVSGRVVESEGGLTTLIADRWTDCGAQTTTPLAVGPIPDGNDFEALEGMRIEFSDPLTLVDSYRWSDGELVVSTGQRLWQPTEISPPKFDHPEIRANRRRALGLRLTPAEHTPPLPRFRLGDQLDGLQGVVDQDRGHRLLAEQSPQFVSRNPRPQVPQRQGSLRVASFNVLNYFNGPEFPTPRGASSEQELARQQSKIIAAMKAIDAELFALAELENDGFGSDSAVAQLTRELAAATDRPYDFVRPEAERIGEDQIAVGILYDASRLVPQGSARITLEPPFEDRNRPPLAQAFRDLETGESFTVVALHLKSKSCRDAEGEQADQRDGQGCWNPRRDAGARALLPWVAGFADVDNTLLIGDFNAYSMEDPMRSLAKLGFHNVLTDRDPPHYSYVYRGSAGSLDHVVVGTGLADRVVAAEVWHINADEPRWRDYNLEERSPPLDEELFAADPFRSSDHDPLVVDFR